MKNSILLVITGSIAATKAPKLAELLLKQNIACDVILTKSAQEFVKEADFKNLGIEHVFSELFDAEMEGKIGHIELSRKNDLILVYPATANFMAKAAHGRADDLASTMLLASNKQIFMAPAMNVEMWENEITQTNLAELEKRALQFIYPEKGMLACGEEGEGRVKEPEDVVELMVSFFALKAKLAGKKILLTVGGTRENIDPVRFIGNSSSGKQGVALAKKFAEFGAEVTMVKGCTDCRIPKNFKIIEVVSADEMYKSVMTEIAVQEFDLGIFTAAVADFKPVVNSADKIKKEKLQTLEIKLEKNPDILAETGKSEYRPKILVGFAAETNNHEANALRKLDSKNCDVIALNDVSGGKVFGESKNQLTFYSKNHEPRTVSGTKEQAAMGLVKFLVSYL